MNYVNRKYKDTLFRALFSERKHLLSLYNAVNETNYTNEEDLEINTLENVIYLKMKNDISFLFGFSLNLYEHQSLVNPNMPLRDLFYVADLLQKIVKDRNLYSSSLVGIPTPKFVMFYNGTDEEAAQMELKLSDAYMQKVGDPDLELKVKMYNINSGKNPELLEHCQRLREYTIFVEKVRTYAAQMEISEAVNRAVDECIAEGVLADFLSEHRAEAVAMSIYEYDEEKHMKAEREEHYALGLQDGVQKGLQQGRYEAFLEMGFSEEEAKHRAEAAAMSIYEYDEEKHMKAEREEHYALGLQDGIHQGLEKGLHQGRYEAFLEMGLSEEEARRRAQAGNENGKDNVGVQRDNTVEK